MLNLLRLLRGLPIICLGGFTLSAGVVPVFEKYDRVVFIGDSITHGGRYHADIYLFYATRFPNQPFTAYNCGISGDTAPGTNLRFDEDIAPNRPTSATVMLGMNDAAGYVFEAKRPLQVKISGQANSYASYTTAMDQLAASLNAIDCRIIFIKPSIYDQTAELERESLMGKNDQLGQFSRYIDSLAVKYGAEVIDFHTPMGVINHSLQAIDPSASIVGEDRVHPGLPGHLVMAYHFLKSQNMPQYVSAIQLDAANEGKVLQLINCDLNGSLTVRPGSVRFTATENALPFPINKGQAKALDWVPFQHDLNRQVLAVDNLANGNYALSIDNTLIGRYSSEELKLGIDLSANSATPQYQQSLRVKAMQDMQLKATSRLRTIALVRHSMVRKISPPVDESDHAALSAALFTHLEKSNGKSWYDFLKQQVETFLESVPQEADFKEQELQRMREMWLINQPTPHDWLLEKVD